MNNQETNSKQKKTGKVWIVFAVIAGIFSLFSLAVAHNIIPGCIALGQTLLFIAAYLIKNEIISLKPQKIYIAFAIIGCMLIIPYVMTNVSSGKNNIKAEKIEWSDIVLNDVIPTPNTDKGIIRSNSDTYLSIEFQKVSQDEFSDYVSVCKEKGYNTDVNYTTSRFEAKNPEGYDLTLSYDGQKELNIYLTAPKEEETPTTAPVQEETEQKTNQGSADGVNPDFKATMDSYEAFFDEYIAFMQKYQNSSDVTSMLSDFNSYMTKYTEVMKKLNSIDKNSLSVADAAYYTEVMARISQKLASIS